MRSREKLAEITRCEHNSLEMSFLNATNHPHKINQQREIIEKNEETIRNLQDRNNDLVRQSDAYAEINLRLKWNIFKQKIFGIMVIALMMVAVHVYHIGPAKVWNFIWNAFWDAFYQSVGTTRIEPEDPVATATLGSHASLGSLGSLESIESIGSRLEYLESLGSASKPSKPFKLSEPSEPSKTLYELPSILKFGLGTLGKTVVGKTPDDEDSGSLIVVSQ